MPDVEIIIKSSKAAWVSRIFKEGNLSLQFINSYLYQYGLKTNQLLYTYFTSLKEIESLALPKFYKEVFLAYHFCQSKKNIKDMSSHEILRQLLWCNNMFKSKDKCLLYGHWIKSGFLYVKDLYSQGVFLTENNLFTKLSRKQNWVAEYSTIKRIVTKLVHKFGVDTTIGQFINIKETKTPNIIVRNSCTPVCDCKTSFFYQILVDKKFCRSPVENYWQREFDLEITSEMWKSIYRRNCKNIFDNKLCEFKYKLLHNLLCCNEKLFKWKRRPSSNCNACHLKETIKHMFF